MEPSMPKMPPLRFPVYSKPIRKSHRGSLSARELDDQRLLPLPNATYIDVRRPTRATKLRPKRAAETLNQDALSILHPFVDRIDVDGDIVQLMYDKWLAGVEESDFSSTILYCDVKLQEAKRITSRVQLPNRFLTCVCIKLLDLLSQRLGSTGKVLQSLNQELIRSIYSDAANVLPVPDVMTSVPYYVVVKRLKKAAGDSVREIDDLETCIDMLKEKRDNGSEGIEQTIQRWQKSIQSHVFYHWVAIVRYRQEFIRVVGRVFDRKTPFSTKNVFRAWRVHALRRAYQRESSDYQIMLSVTAESLSLKDAELKEEREKNVALKSQVEKLSTANTNLRAQVRQLEQQLAKGQGSTVIRGDQLEFDQDQIDDECALEENENNGTLNKSLLDASFLMARLVESVSLQSIKESLDRIEGQADVNYMFKIYQNYKKSELKDEDGEDVLNLGPENPSGIQELGDLSPDRFLIKWASYQLEESATAQAMGITGLKNFSSDLRDGKRYALLLHHLYPTEFSESLLHEIDLDCRINNIVSFARGFIKPMMEDFLTADRILNGDAVSNGVFIAILFVENCISTKHGASSSYRQKFEEILISWRQVRSLLLDIKRDQQDITVGKTKLYASELQQCSVKIRELHDELRSQEEINNFGAFTLCKLNRKMIHFTWEIFEARIKGEEVNIVDERFDETMKEYLRLDPAKLTDVLLDSRVGGRRGSVTMIQLQSKARIEELTEVVAKYCKDLHDIFRHYSAGALGGNSSSMSSIEFDIFCRDCGILDRKVTSAVIEQIYLRSLGLQGGAPLGDREMIGHEFTGALIRVADMKFDMLPFGERLSQLLETLIIPNASRSECDAFREQLAKTEIVSVFKKHKESLQRTFYYYAAMNADDERSIDVQGFFALTKDCKLLGSNLTDQNVKHLFLNIQSQDETDFDLDDDCKVDFDEYMEAIAAMTEYVVCSPYLPLYKRIDTFITETFLPRARQKRK